MSHVTELVLLITGIDPNDTALLTDIDLDLAVPGKDWSFHRIDRDLAGGPKMFCSQVWLGTGNFLPIDDLLHCLQDLELEVGPDGTIQLYAHDEDGRGFSQLFPEPPGLATIDPPDRRRLQ